MKNGIETSRKASRRESVGREHEDEFPEPRAKRRRVSINEDEDEDEEEEEEEEKDEEEEEEEEEEQFSLPTQVVPSRIQKAVTEALKQPHEPMTLSGQPLTTIQSDTDFASLNISPWLVHSLRSMAVHNPTAIQKSCIPEILKGRDCIGGSRTGTGKTIAFAVPILQKWAADPFGIYAVILTPTRELALQIFEQFQALGASQSLKVILITGGSEMRPQAAALAKRPHIVVATPGRLADHILTSGEETVIGLRRAKVVVLDEADRLLSPGPGSMLPDINTCLSALPPSASRLTLLFTATVTPEVRALKSQPRPSSRPPIFVSEITDVPTSTDGEHGISSLVPPTLKQTYMQVPFTHKDAFLHILLQTPEVSVYPSIIIFTNRTATADVLHRTLHLLDHSVTALHSDLPQSQRNKNLSEFRAQKARILVATDVAGRGLDIPTVNLVVNFDVPRNPVDYIHRVGRTARAGRPGTSITFVGQRDVELILAIEEYLSTPTSSSTTEDVKNKTKMTEYQEEGVNVETRVIKGRILKDVGEARMEALRDVEGNKDINGWRRKIKKDRKTRPTPAVY